MGKRHEASQTIPEQLTTFRGLALEGCVTMHGRSMEPTIPAGSTVRLRGFVADPPRVGEIVGFWQEGKVVIHRVRRTELRDGQHWFQAQGDANRNADCWQNADRIVGRVTRVPPGAWRRRSRQIVRSGWRVLRRKWTQLRERLGAASSGAARS